MREIKFRVWDKNKKQMNLGGAFHTLEIDGKSQEWFGMRTPHPDDCELMQFTGLHDKNGKEIYEGDVVKMIKLGMGAVGDLVLKVDNGKFEEGKLFEIEFGNCRFYGCSVSVEDESYPDLDVNSKFEVIGNIYENPELVRDK